MALPRVMKPRMPGDSGVVVVARTRPLVVVAEGGLNGMTALWAALFAGPATSCYWVSSAPLERKRAEENGEQSGQQEDRQEEEY